VRAFQSVESASPWASVYLSAELVYPSRSPQLFAVSVYLSVVQA